MPPRPVSRPAAANRARVRRALAGYTMIELLTVIAIIVIVMGFVTIGLRSVIASRQRDQTLGTLQALDNAMNEMTNTPSGAQKMFTVQLPGIYFPPQAGAYDYTQSNYRTWIGVPASALESQVRTGRVIDEILISNATARTYIEGLAAEKKARFTTSATSVNAAAYTPKSNVPLDAWGNPVLFVFDGLQIATGTNVGRPFTVDAGAGEQEVGGLTNIYSDAEKSFYEPANALTPAPSYALNVGPTQKRMPNAPAVYNRAADPKLTTYTARLGPTGTREQALRSPDHRPFWMSAGPDGKYETHDDNVYSFGS